jgi:hypothetical protein
LTWAWSTLLFVALFAVSATWIGRALTERIVGRERPFFSLYLAPILGTAIVLHVAVLGGWVHGRFAHGAWVAVAQLVVTVGAFCSLRAKRSALRAALLVALYSTIAALPAWFTVARFGAFNPYNDTFTYLVHGQYLQEHAFHEPAPATGFQADLTQVSLYQQHRMRMGASFLLAWVQALFGLRWAHEIYPAVVGLALGASALAAAAAFHRWGLPSRRASLAAGLVVPFTLNGLSHGALTGFLPQTFGLAFAFAVLLAWGVLLRRSTERPAPGFALPAIVATLVAASAHSYGELAPFLAIAGVLSLAGVWFRARPRSAALWRTGVAVAAGTLALVNFELLRLLHALRIQAGALVGGPVPWSVPEFALFALGLRAGAGDGDTLLLGSRAISYVVLAWLVFASLRAAARERLDRRRIDERLPMVALLAVLLAAFALFRYAATNPWNVGQGQTWSQFKIVGWASPFLLGIALPLIVRAAGRGRRRFTAPTIFLATVPLVGLAVQFHKADERTRPVRRETGAERDPFEVYAAFGRLVSSTTAPDDLLYLHLGGDHHKSRQMLTYFLTGRRAISNWLDDGYLFARMPEGERNLPVTMASWIVTFEGPGGTPRPFARVGALGLRRLDEAGGILVSFDATYGRESDASGWWHWTRKLAEAKFLVPPLEPGHPRTAIVQFAYCSPFRRDRLRIVVESGSRRHEIFCATQEGWGECLSSPLAIDSPELRVAISSARRPKPIGPGDAREVSFLVKNLSVALD